VGTSLLALLALATWAGVAAALDACQVQPSGCLSG